ncbi:MAG: DUF4331 family protein [Planctomycetales bacterium]|nr:DUF4331 family protein [Planctomycetales bacterium]
MRHICLLYIAVVAVFSIFSAQLHAADHLDSPTVQVDHSVDINDLYAFQSPADPNNVVLIMTVNPLAGVVSGTAFNTRAVYEFAIDVDSDARPDVCYRFYFAGARGGAQRFIVLESNGRIAGTGITGSSSRLRNGGMVTAGVFDDPFFFDLNGFNNGLAFTGVDFFAGANVSAIVLEVPRSAIPAAAVGVSARTVVRGRQFDRMGRPAINTVLIPSMRKDLFNATAPVDDVRNFSGDVRATLVALGNSPARAAELTAVLLPDLLTFNTTSSAGFLNGRQLADDVIDAELQLLTGNPAASDGVSANDVPFLSVFPYLASPH